MFHRRFKHGFEGTKKFISLEIGLRKPGSTESCPKGSTLLVHPATEPKAYVLLWLMCFCQDQMKSGTTLRYLLAHWEGACTMKILVAYTSASIRWKYSTNKDNYRKIHRLHD